MDVNTDNGEYGLDYEDIISVRHHERNGKAFKIVQLNPHGFCYVRHANNKPYTAAPASGTFTSFEEAIKAIERIPEDDIKPTQRKVVLTPKVKEDKSSVFKE